MNYIEKNLQITITFYFLAVFRLFCLKTFGVPTPICCKELYGVLLNTLCITRNILLLLSHSSCGTWNCRSWGSVVKAARDDCTQTGNRNQIMCYSVYNTSAGHTDDLVSQTVPQKVAIVLQCPLGWYFYILINY